MVMDTLVLSSRERLLLLFMAAGELPLDPVRIQKGLFILSQKTPREWLPDDARYDFEPYNYGPFAKPIYSDLHSLRMHGYLKTEDSWSQSWVFHSVTDTGRERAEQESRNVDPRLLPYIASVRQFVTERSFRELLDAVYAEFPNFATKSLFRR